MLKLGLKVIYNWGLTKPRTETGLTWNIFLNLKPNMPLNEKTRVVTSPLQNVNN